MQNTLNICVSLHHKQNKLPICLKVKLVVVNYHASSSEVRVDSAKDVENIHKQVVAKFGDDVRVITKEENLEENASVMKALMTISK